MIINIDDCGTLNGIVMEPVYEGEEVIVSLYDRILGRVALDNVVDVITDQVIVKSGDLIDEAIVKKIEEAGIEKIRVRSVLCCESPKGICARCYGRDLATRRLVEQGTAVGIIAAQSIGEPGTQLTMRTFHSGGVSESDITHGLPRVVELFEARTPKGAALVAEISGAVRVETIGRERKVTIVGNEGEIQEVSVPIARHLLVADGQEVEVGTPLHDGPLDPKLMMKYSAVPDGRSPERVPRPGCIHSRQAHRTHRSSDDPPRAGRRDG